MKKSDRNCCLGFLRILEADLLNRGLHCDLPLRRTCPRSDKVGGQDQHFKQEHQRKAGCLHPAATHVVHRALFLHPRVLCTGLVEPYS